MLLMVKMQDVSIYRIYQAKGLGEIRDLFFLISHIKLFIIKVKKGYKINSHIEQKNGGEEMSEKKVINGIPYENPEEAKKAQKEWEGIQYILSKNNMEDMEAVLALYNKLAERKVLKTEVGTKFLRELKEQLLETKEIEKKRIYGFSAEDEQWLQIKERQKIRKEKQKKEEEQKNQQKDETDYRQKYYHSLILNILLIITILIMAYITLNSNHINILNYENELINKYASWETSLQQKEAELNARERELAKKDSQN